MNRTVLVVDDQPGTRKLLRYVLEESGYAVLDAGDERAAWDAAKTYGTRINLVLIDVELLGIKSGPYLAIGLRSLLGAPMVFMSGHQREALVSAGHVQPSASFVQKPFKLHEVREAVTLALSLEPMHGTGATGRHADGVSRQAVA